MKLCTVCEMFAAGRKSPAFFMRDAKNRYLIYVKNNDLAKAEWLWQEARRYRFEIYHLDDFYFGVSEYWCNAEYKMQCVFNAKWKWDFDSFGPFPGQTPVEQTDYVIQHLWGSEASFGTMFETAPEILKKYEEFLWLTTPYAHTNCLEVIQKLSEKDVQDTVDRVLDRINYFTKRDGFYELSWEEEAVLRDLREAVQEPISAGGF